MVGIQMGLERVLSMAFFKIYYSYAGSNNVNNVLNEVKDPVRTLKTVGTAALLTACIMYALANLAYLAVVPVEDFKRSGDLVAALFFQRLNGALPTYNTCYLVTAIQQ